MRRLGTDVKESPRQRAARRRTRPPSARARKPPALDIFGLIETHFDRWVSVTENGKRSRMTVLQAIHKQLWTKEMSGDAKALRARLKYEEFDRKQQPHRTRKIIVIGGLPDDLPRRERADDV